MENLTLDENAAAQAAQPQQPQMPLLGPSPQNQQLPPQMFTTAAQLLDMTDSKDFSFGAGMGEALLLREEVLI